MFVGRWQPFHKGHKDKLKDLIDKNKVVVSIIPDIESINYGRGVGYEIIEHKPPQNIKDISVSNIRIRQNEN